MLHGQMASEAERLREVRLSVAGTPASRHDIYQFVSTSIIRYGLESDLRGLTSITQCVYRRVLLSQRDIDIQTYAQDMKTLKLGFIAYMQSAQVGTFTGFKRRCSPEVHYKWLFRMIETLWGSFPDILLWLSFDERMLLDTNEKQVWPEILDYLEFEDQLATRTYPEPIVDQLSAIVSDWFKDFSLGESIPRGRFGPGAVAEAKGRPSFLEKALTCVWDPEVVQIFAEMYDVELDEVLPGRPCSPEEKQDLYRNRIIFRPKNALKHRIISAEPTWLSWLQQDLKAYLYEIVEAHPKIMSWFSNQEESRRLALKGSVDGSYATIDFSNASDSITTSLVSQVYRRTYFAEALLAARSTHAKLPRADVEIRLDKFAPMGSATCFVTMDVLLCACCELAIRESCGRESRRGDYVVYGDDVVIRVDSVDQFRRIVDALGMSVNSDKSYWDPLTPHWYRESCGIEAYDGLDCTPIRYSRFQQPIFADEAPSDGEWLPSIVSLMNRLCLRGLFHARSAVMQLMYLTLDRACADTDREKSRRGRRMRHVWDRLERVDAGDFAKGDSGPCCVVVPDGTATNYRCRFRWNSDLQRREALVSNFQTRPVSTQHQGLYDTDLYMLWYFRARTELRTSEPCERILDGVAGVSSQQWRDIWAEV